MLRWHKPLSIVAKHARDQVFYFQYSSIILPGLRGSIEVTRSYSGRPFLCTLEAHSPVKIIELLLKIEHAAHA